VIMHVRARSGRSIAHLSALPSEQEVLLLPNFEALVSQPLEKRGDVYVLQLIEAARERAARGALPALLTLRIPAWEVARTQKFVF